MRAGDYAAAIAIYRELEQLEPDDPTWSERCASAHHALGETREELACLRRSLALLVEHGQALAAIATGKLILDIEPDDPDTLDVLRGLYSDPGIGPASASSAPSVGRLPDVADAPLEELQLTEVIPESRALRMGDGGAEGISEIPIEATAVVPFDIDDLDVDIVDTVRAIEAPESAVTRPPTDARKPTEQKNADDARSRPGRDELTRTPLFGSLDVTTLHRLLTRVKVVELGAGEVLFREGDPADTLFVIVDGAVVPIAEGPPRTRMAVLEQGSFFGEIGLVTNQPRNATIEALVDTRLLAIDRRVMWSLIRGEAGVSKILLRFLRERLIDRTVRTHPFFAPFANLDPEVVARQFRFLEVRGGAPVLEQGLPSRGIFVLLAGTMEVVDEKADRVVDRLAPGDHFGAIPLLRQEPAAASVVAVGKCWVLVLEESSLRRMLAGRPRVEDALIGFVTDDDRIDSLV